MRLINNPEMKREDASQVLGPIYGGSFATGSDLTLPFVLPGETVDSASNEIQKPSVHRVLPQCVHFGTCGGCHYQHADYSAQLELKRTVLRGIFCGAGLTYPAQDQSSIQTEAAEPFGYRNRIRLRIEPDEEGALRPGYSLRATNAFLPVTMCPIAAPLLWNAANAITELGDVDPLVRRWLLIASEVELYCTPDESKLQLALFVRSAEGGKRESSSFAGLCERIKAAIPELVGAGASLDPELNRRARKLWQGTAWGAEGLSYPVKTGNPAVPERNYWLPRGAFFQVNRFLIDRLVQVVTEGQSGDLAWDLYAGVGLFTRALAQNFTTVVAVEGSAAAIASLESAARAEKGIVPIESSTLDFLRFREHQRERPSLVVLDPPRAGLGSEGAAILARIKPQRLVYVSCDPTTLVRDLGVLASAYRIKTVRLIDLFPQTFHIETIVYMEL